MKTVIVKGDQSWFDVAVQELGTVEGVFGLLGSADVVSDYPASGRLLKITQEVLALEYEPLEVSQSAGSRAQSTFKRVIVLQDQSWFDVSLQELGSIEGVFGLLNPSGDTLDVNPSSGREVKILASAVIIKNNTAWYQQHSIKPATGISAGSTIVIGSGIGYWAIEVDFEVQ